jgi:toxin ParE1/3/4
MQEKSSRKRVPGAKRMAADILPAAQLRLLEIWDYTEKKWGGEQADKYVRELIDAINRLPQQRSRWRLVRNQTLPGAYYFLHQHHYIFFREISRGSIGVISILHENMNFPARLKQDAKGTWDVSD